MVIGEPRSGGRGTLVCVTNLPPLRGSIMVWGRDPWADAHRNWLASLRDSVGGANSVSAALVGSVVRLSFGSRPSRSSRASASSCSIDRAVSSSSVCVAFHSNSGLLVSDAALVSGSLCGDVTDAVGDKAPSCLVTDFV